CSPLLNVVVLKLQIQREEVRRRPDSDLPNLSMPACKSTRRCACGPLYAGEQGREEVCVLQLRRPQHPSSRHHGGISGRGGGGVVLVAMAATAEWW
ncbi:unnamed protein product, partial [Urochloa humidicola]